MRALALAMLAAGALPVHRVVDRGLCVDIEPDAGSLVVAQPDGGIAQLFPTYVHACRVADRSCGESRPDSDGATPADWVIAWASVAAAVIAGAALVYEMTRK